MLVEKGSVKKILDDEELTGKIIGAAIDVHKTLGPGFLESLYENALAIELGKRGIRCERQVEVPVHYCGEEIGRHRLDLLVEGEVVVELKAVSKFEDVHYVIVKSYMKATGKKNGLLMNFAKPTLDVKKIYPPG